nr:PIN domain-containing protein [uncultured Mucilaginibacter sp.]
MNGINYLVDTNCFIYLLDENPIILPFLNDGWAFSYITEIELLSKKGMSNHEDHVIREMLASCLKISHSQILTDIVIDLKRKYKIKLPDAIIAASAKLLQIPLITVDKDFADISDIDCILLDFA